MQIAFTATLETQEKQRIFLLKKALLQKHLQNYTDAHNERERQKKYYLLL